MLSDVLVPVHANLIATLVAGLHFTSPTTTFSTASTPAKEVHSLALFVLTITGLVFLAVSALLAYAVWKFRAKPGDIVEPAQVFGSTQIELAWTIIPILIIVVLFLGTARVIFAIEDARKPPSAIDVVVVGHQFWWEFRYPKYNVVTANELHVPMSDPKNPTPTFMKLTSADVMHSFWVPRLAGKTDLLPNRVNEMWMDPYQPGMYEGQCAQFCGPEHAKMLLRVYVDTPEQFQAWVANQQRVQESATSSNEPAANGPNVGNMAIIGLHGPSSVAGAAAGIPPNSPSTLGHIAQLHEVAEADAGMTQVTPQQGRRVFEEQACINCHAVNGTVADGRYGPDLTHLASRSTIAAGAADNTPANLVAWLADPNDIKEGTLMPAMHLTNLQNRQITAYLTTLH